MNTYNMSYSINGVRKCFDVTSKHFSRGKDLCLTKDTNKNEKISNIGYTVEKLPNNFFEKIKNSISNFIFNELKKQNINPENFDIENYHTYVDDITHLKLIKNLRGGIFGIGGIDLSYLGVNYLEIDDFVNDIVLPNKKISCVYNLFGLKIKHFWLRIVRPNKLDNNAPHKDTHINRLSSPDIVNIYLPIVGSNEKSSLPLIPYSHLEKENEYIISKSPCFINGKKFNAPALVHRNKGLDLITPNPDYGQVMIFNPSLVHGGGSNDNLDQTRISVEMRFFS